MTNEAWLVFGLGNPGPKYETTRHNIGQMVIAELAHRIGVNLTRTKLRSNVGTSRLPTGSIPGVPGPRVVLATSTGYMNESGGPVRQLADFYSIDTDRIIAVHDDVDIPYDTIKAKVGGGEGGHNGLRSMTSALGTKNYPRIRAGVGRPLGRQDTADYVLKPFSKDERATLPIFISDLADAVEMYIVEGLEKVQLKYHSK
ncbi:MAG: aminoacyl-tRNA hydrolase [Brevibacterium aurantiacum]|uniref:Peptidyl-tRNA hydrolase n=1 Tax=Brevibacterium aurantiacum TaxID=273384 RepID=A0A2A3X6I2_BREAU|nr:aminoacyl-tRNA hydrolase [Brevibacterium aurantiacum]MDN5550298.1 aminoacyl-tRNA hydrolase [Brevibacterium sp.]AZL05277.1 aminoacyl-tRNA hydrolase [Brevibacterium aurantiacum]AZL12464.1 aminoacyl-tRNA hydrolase [Brevibacterium aurantiacum]AZT96731.1 aminoacyl-tRNA hydrolase [Brevibacterium aurantiacum]PCC19385.1 aminoacyl-tRNA hydrolase [Brevibacterium aurantiacum]